MSAAFRLGLWCGLAFVPLSAASQDDPSFDPAITTQCLEAREIGEARRVCIGQAAEACIISSPGGSSTVGMGGCINAEFEFWDDRLNAAYGAARAKARRQDGENQGATASVAEALRAMQRAWIGYRDHTCDFERAQWGDGTGRGPATLSCLLRLTAEQTLYLEAAAQEY